MQTVNSVSKSVKSGGPILILATHQVLGKEKVTLSQKAITLYKGIIDFCGFVTGFIGKKIGFCAP